MGFRTPNFQQFQQPQQQKQFQDQDQDLQPMGKRQKGTGFTNIGRILGANVGAGERMGRQVGQAVGMQAGQARAGVTEAQRKYEEDKAAAERKAHEAIGGVGRYLNNEAGLAGMSEEDAKKAREAFTKEGQYAGPKGLEQEAQLRARAEALGDVATMGMAGRGGRQQLTRSLVAGPGMYTRGQSLLDSTLLGQSAAAQRAIEAGSRQALGAQQDIAETIGSTREQAKAAESAIGKERADVAKKVGEKLTSTEEAGGTAAKQFADDINRFNELMTATRSVDDEGSVTYKDASGKILEVTDRDRELISNPNQFGLDTSDILIDPNSDLTRGVLGDIATQGAFTYQKGMKRYTPEQEAIARNLALLKGETPQEYNPFETDIFKTSGQNIAEKSESYRGMQEQKLTRENLMANRDKLVNFQKNYADYLMGKRRDLDMNPLNARDYFAREAGLDPNYIVNLAKNYQGRDDMYAQVEAQRLEKEAQKYANPTTSLKDYLRKMYGIQGQRDLPVEPRRPRQV